MAKKDHKGISEFGADDYDLIGTPNVNVNPSINPAVKFEKIGDPLEKLQEENPRKELTTVMKGIYWDSEVWDVIEEQSKKLGRGGKSQLVNEIVKDYFIKKGLL